MRSSTEMLLMAAGIGFLATAADRDREFITKAADGGRMEIELGTKAQEKASNQQVKQFAADLVRDHTQSNAELEELAKQKGILLDTGISTIGKAKITKLTMQADDGFDKAYIQAMVDDHNSDIAEFEKAAVAAEDPALRSFAAKALPVLRKHLQRASELNVALSNSGS